jgi:23S rRNA (guanosine2251-2'-O)-methyltransferase
MKHKESGKNQLIYGIHAVQEAIDAGQEFERIYIINDGRSDAILALKQVIKEHKLPVHQVPVHKLNRLYRGNHQGVIAFLSIVPNVPLSELTMSAFERGETPRILVLDNVTDVRNFGAISRSAVAFGYHGIVIPYRGSALIHADAVKASAGALMKIPVSRVMSLKAAVQELSASGLEVIAITEKTKKTISGQIITGPYALVLGSEEKGISADILDRCAEQFSIPITDEIDSLNVSVAAAIAMFTLRNSEDFSA